MMQITVNMPRLLTFSWMFDRSDTMAETASSIKEAFANLGAGAVRNQNTKATNIGVSMIPLNRHCLEKRFLSKRQGTARANALHTKITMRTVKNL